MKRGFLARLMAAAMLWGLGRPCGAERKRFGRRNNGSQGGDMTLSFWPSTLQPDEP